MSLNRKENALKQALQKIQRDERAKIRTTHKNIPKNPRLAAVARHPSPEIGSPTNFKSFNLETSSEIESSEIVNPSNLLEEPSTLIDESQNLSASSVAFELEQTSSSSPKTTTPIEYLFSQLLIAG